MCTIGLATMASVTFLVSVIIIACHVVLGGSTYAEGEFDLLLRHVRAKHAPVGATDASPSASFESGARTLQYSPVYVGGQDGLMEADKIDTLPGQPAGVNFSQYSGYVTVDPTNGRALFYYFVESPDDPSTKPLVLWLNGGPGCSSFGTGAMMELGPFKVNSDGKTLRANDHAWNKEANILFLESPAGVGFSYSNTTADYSLSGDKRTAEDSYTFLVNWLERFPQYKTRDFFITGESYAGHYIPQLAQTILLYNKVTNQTVINLRGIAIGNGWIDDETNTKGMFEFFWTHALTSDEIHDGITLNCNFSPEVNTTEACDKAVGQLWESFGDIFIYNIYAPLCTDSSSPRPDLVFDPCSKAYIKAYLNLPKVQRSLHANVTGLPYLWTSCSNTIRYLWTDWQTTLLPIIQELMASDLRVWIYSGDIDGIVPVTATRYAINNLNTTIQTAWYPWYTQEEVGGYVVEYQQLTFVTVRGAGHYVPSYQPERALTLFSSFVQGKLPPRKQG